MASELAIQLTGVSKVYPLYSHPFDRMKELAHPRGRSFHTEFPALTDVSLQIARGESCGIIGRNGSGKSTLLQIVTGVLAPSAGNVEVVGRVAALLELGTGFDPQATGLENISAYFAIHGLTRETAAARLDDVLAFADIGEFVERPVKLYSTGMFVRLAFACAVNLDPDIFIIDEALAVGDLRFVQKCYRKLKQLTDAGKTLLFVTHDMSSVRSLAGRAIWLEAGRVQQDGPVRQVTDRYISYMTYGSAADAAAEPVEPESPTQGLWQPISDDHYTHKGSADLLGARLRRIDGDDRAYFEGGEEVEYALRVRLTAPVAQPMLGFAVLNQKAATLFHYNSEIYGQDLPRDLAPGTYVLTTRFRLPHLAKGYYNLYTNLVDGDYQQNQSLFMVNGICEFQVLPPGAEAKLTGLIRLDQPSLSIAVERT